MSETALRRCRSERQLPRTILQLGAQTRGPYAHCDGDPQLCVQLLQLRVGMRCGEARQRESFSFARCRMRRIAPIDEERQQPAEAMAREIEQLPLQAHAVGSRSFPGLRPVDTEAERASTLREDIEILAATTEGPQALAGSAASSAPVVPAGFAQDRVRGSPDSTRTPAARERCACRVPGARRPVRRAFPTSRTSARARVPGPAFPRSGDRAAGAFHWPSPVIVCNYTYIEYAMS